MTKLREYAKLVGVNLLVLGVGLAAIELAFGTWFQDAHALYQFTKPRNVAIVQDNPFPGGPPVTRYTRDANGFRGLDADVSEIDILTVGGSTTDQRYLDDDVTFQQALKSRFADVGRRLVIANAGIDGQSTIGHINNFSSWFNRIDRLQPRYILFYVGINDLLRVGEADVYDRVSVESPLRDMQLYIRDKSVFYQLYLLAKQYLQPHPYRHGFLKGHIAVDQALTDKPFIDDYRTPQVVASLDQLKARILELDKRTRDMGAKSIFVTQRSARWTRIDGKIWGLKAYDTEAESEFSAFQRVNGVDIYMIEKMVADTIMSACVSVDAICLNLMDEIEFDLRNDFYDPVHTTRSGAKAIGDYLFERLRSRI